AVSLMINTLHQNANVAYWLGVDYWNRGITSEAVHVVMDYGFRQLRLHRIGAGCFPENMGSVKVIQKNGMRREGTRRESCLKDGTFRDITWFATLRREWEQR
ncbi:MAG TPA: GNAT family protein, partial [Thermomicrobiales bacterium]|nr:GNAT family protein [Thermomicrobiales bacterium]